MKTPSKCALQHWLWKNFSLIHFAPSQFLYKPEICLDETGAGDCFIAILLYFLSKYSFSDVNDNIILNATKHASAASSFLIEQKGISGLQGKYEIIQRINNQKNP